MTAPPPVETGPDERPVRASRRPRRRIWLLSGIAAIGVIVAAGWVAREQLADALITRQLDQAGVDASYDIAELSPTHQRLTNVRIGDPARPDLIASEIELWVGYSWTGPVIQRVSAHGVQIRGRFDGERVRLGQLDKLLPAPSDEPVELPDIDLNLRDAAALIDTPWGRAALGIEGRGNPRRAFAGSAAAVSERLSAGGCIGQRIRASGRVRSGGDGVRFAGPIGAAMVDCAAQDVRIAGVSTRMAVSMPVDFSALEWSGNAGAANVSFAGGRVSRLRGRTDGQWDIGRRVGSSFAAMRFADAAIPSVSARSGALTGRMAFAGGQWRATGGLALAGSSMRGDVARYIDAVTSGRDAPVIGPIAAAVGAAVGAAARDFVVTMPFAARGTAGGLIADVKRIAVRSRSGAVITLAGPEPVIAWDRRGLRLAGRLEARGGGLPGIVGDIERTAVGGYRGVVNSEPYSASDAALALTTLRFALDARGNGRFETAMTMSGPFSGGRIDGLSLPVSGAVGPGGRVTLDSGCRAVSYQRLVLSNLYLTPQRLSLCSAPGQPLLAFGRGTPIGAVTSGPVELSGRLGDSPIRLGVSNVRYSLSGAGDFRDFAMILGSGDSAVRLNAGSLSLRSDPRGLVGTFGDADARIGAIQLVLDGLQGQWRYAGGIFGAEGEMDVSDVVTRTPAGEIVRGSNGQPFGRFNPMTIPNARLTLANGVIEVAGQFQERSTATPVANMRLVHRLSSGTGEAAFNVVPITFTQGGLQPEQLTELALGVAANVEGTVTGNGRIEWTSDAIRSSGEFSTEGTNLAAAFGPVERLNGTVRFNDLLNLTTAPGQVVRVGSINPGIEVVDGEILYQLLPNQQVRIESGRWPFAGGMLRLHPGLIDLAADRPRYLTFDVEGIDAARFLERYGFENISATGVFDGVLPTVFDGNGGRVEGGALTVRDGGGALAYVGELTTRDLGYFGNLAFGALRSVRYDALVIRLNGNIDGEMLTEVSFTGLGQGPGARNNFLTRQVARLPFAFNIRINAPFRQLLTSARSLYDPTILIDQNLPALVREQAEAEARARAGASAGPPPRAEPPVQQQESDDQP